MMTLYFHHNLAHAYYWLLHSDELIPFSIINNMSISVIRSSSTRVFFKVAGHAKLGAEINSPGSSSYIAIHILLEFSRLSARGNTSLVRYKSFT